MRAEWIASLVVVHVAACGSSAKNTVDTGGSGSGGDGGAVVTLDCTKAQADTSARTQAIVDAANAFLATLSSTSGVQFAFSRPAGASAYVGAGNRLGAQYGSAVWSNYPASDVPRPGMARSAMTAAQLAAEDKLLQTVLSSAGYTKVQQIMGADQALCDAGQNFSCGTAAYTIGIFGTPSTSAPWMIEYGAHHLGLNIVIDATQGTVAPTLTGAQPAVYMDGSGTAVRALAAENDAAFALLGSLDDTQKAAAITKSSIGDLVLGPGKFTGSNVPAPEGVRASTFTAAQKSLLVGLITQWSGIIQDAYVCAQLADIESGFDDTYFLWSGATTHDAGQNGSAYFRIQGPKVWIEFSPQSGGPAGATPTTHVHTVYRDLTNEYGHAW